MCTSHFKHKEKDKTLNKTQIAQGLQRRLKCAVKPINALKERIAQADTVPPFMPTSDGGRVVLVSTWGDDLDVVNVAKVSFDKHDPSVIAHLGEGLTDRQLSLLNFLWKNKHTSPFRHQYLKFQITAPIFVMRQWMKHTVGCAWNEASGRYIKFSDDFYAPKEFRASVKDTKQGSGGPIESAEIQESALTAYNDSLSASYLTYQYLLSIGVCHEQARTVMPLATMTRCVWTCSLQAFLNFLELRLSPHAQLEIQEYAQACLSLVIDQGDFIETLRAALALSDSPEE